MNITNNNFLNFKNIQNNSAQNNGHNYRKTAPLACDSVSFTGVHKTKEIKDINDKAFVSILGETLKLNEEGKEKLNNAIYDFLEENNIQALDEIGGDENFDSQYELHNKISSSLSLSEDTSEYLAEEIINRCDNKEDYIPLGLSGFEREHVLEKVMTGEIAPAKGMSKVTEIEEDNKLYIHIKNMLRQTPEESYRFREEVDAFLKEENFDFISDLFKNSSSDDDMDNLNKQAALLERLEKKFDLSETEQDALDMEFLNRGTRRFQRVREYNPKMPVHIKDFDLLDNIVTQGGYEYGEGFNRFTNHLFDVMNDEAEENNYKNIFEIFNNKDNLSGSSTLEFINNDETLSHNQKMDLIIALFRVAKNPEEYSKNVPKHLGKDNFYAGIQADMISEKIIETYKLADTFDSESGEIIRKDIKTIVKKMYPLHVEDGKNCDVKQISYEIAEKYRLKSDAEKEIEQIIADVKAGGEKAADVWFLSKLLGSNE